MKVFVFHTEQARLSIELNSLILKKCLKGILQQQVFGATGC